MLWRISLHHVKISHDAAAHGGSGSTPQHRRLDAGLFLLCSCTIKPNYIINGGFPGDTINRNVRNVSEIEDFTLIFASCVGYSIARTIYRF